MSNTLKRNVLTALFDPFGSTDSESSYRPHLSTRAWGIPLLLGIGLLVASFAGWAAEPEQFYYSYLVGWSFSLTIALGALFFVMVNHVVRSKWWVVVRRVPEMLAWSFPVLAILGIPLLFGTHDLYHWTHEELYVEGTPYYDPILAGKRAYLNLPFFYVRLAIYFVVWTTISYLLYKLTLKQDVEGKRDGSIQKRLRFHSAWGIPVYAVTTAFASYDILMSLDPHWFSTIFGVYFWAGSFMSALAMTIILYMSAQRGGSLKEVVTAEHYQDLGKLLFGFMAFWAYIAFSQYMLIWYGNIPEETLWYRHRFEHGWQYHSYALIFGHFAIPFVLMLPRFVKRSKVLLPFWAVWLLIMHFVDLHWIVQPVHEHFFGGHAGFHWLDFTSWLGIFCLFVGLVLFRMSRHSLVPQNDPYLEKSLHFHNV